MWKFSYCSRYFAYFNCEDIYTKCCALIKDIKSSSIFFATAQKMWRASVEELVGTVIQLNKLCHVSLRIIRVQFSLVTCLRLPFQASVSFLLFLHLCFTFSTASFALSLTLRLLMSYIYIYIYGAPNKARKANVVYIWTYVWQRWNSLFLFAAQCFNTESMQRGFLCHICV